MKLLCFLLTLAVLLFCAASAAAATAKKHAANAIFGTPLGADEITIIVPSTYNIRYPLPPTLRKGILDGMCVMLVGIAGGVTAVDGHGHWEANDDDNDGDGPAVVREAVTLLSVSLESDEEVLKEIYEMAKWLAGRLRQEAVLVKVNGVAYLVSSTETTVLSLG
ncbi:hypothetical protein BDZ88DRAFT_423562 [Geranomyces variabilis]|nr:hypothetical protein BDZ88DRAFT_423562 [Geranomyces variabilis]KAJ3135081.1 hypothetical protein HDU90_004112 [Geranomyces variabilis]